MLKLINRDYKDQMDESSQIRQTPAQIVVNFLSEELGIPVEEINLTSKLRQDLKVDGEKAVDLLELFSLTHDVNIDSFRVNDYFGDEIANNRAIMFMMWLFGNGRPLKSLTVVDLIKSLETGKLGK